MLIEVPEKVAKKIVVKRDGKKVEFDGAKIALAIQKGFGDIVGNEDPKTAKYNETDVNKVYSKVLGRIEKIDSDKIKIEEIQDLIEEELKNLGYQDVYGAFASYREKRAQSRQLFFDEKKQHKFLKALENLGLKSANVEENKKDRNNDNETTMGNMFQYASTISRQFAITYLMKKKFSEAHENGDIYIHGMNFIPTGTTSSCQIDISKLYDDGFYVGNNYIKEPSGIIAYSNLATVAIQANQNDQYGEQSIPSFDYYMAQGVLKTFKKQLKQLIFDFLELTDFDKFIAVNGIEREIEKINTIDFEPSIFDKYCRESEELKRMFKIAYNKAIEKTKKLTDQAMESFIYDLNTIHSRAGNRLPFSCINFGTDTSPEGRMVTKSILTAINNGLENGEECAFPVAIFKVKTGTNYNKEDTNYDLFELACTVVVKRKNINFSFLDAEFNIDDYKQGDYDTEVAYTGIGNRVLENVVDSNKAVSVGRGTLSTTSINLPRLGIKHGIISSDKADEKGFFTELEEKLDLVKDQLLERYEIQCKKNTYNFPFLLEQNVWIDSEKLKDNDNLKKALKHGVLNIGFSGLAECLKALTGEHQGESKEAQKFGIKIVEFMRKKCDEYSEKYNLNFNLVATPKEEISNKFIKMDQAIYGKLKGITDKNRYTNSFHIPEGYRISTEDKIKIEAQYHSLTNGGHIAIVQIKNGDTKDVINVIKTMKENGIGYGKIVNMEK